MSDFAEVSLESVKKTIQNSPSKSCPSDPIPTRTLSELLAPITIIVNSSLRSSVFPKASKERSVLPLIKKETSILKFTRTFDQSIIFLFSRKFWKGLLQARYAIILQRMAFTPVYNQLIVNSTQLKLRFCVFKMISCVLSMIRMRFC